MEAGKNMDKHYDSIVKWTKLFIEEPLLTAVSRDGGYRIFKLGANRPGDQIGL